MNKDKSSVVLITRTKLMNERSEKENFIAWLNVFIDNQEITRIYIISDKDSYSSLRQLDKISQFHLKEKDG